MCAQLVGQGAVSFGLMRFYKAIREIICFPWSELHMHKELVDISGVSVCVSYEK